MANRIWILGAPDPEMEAIESLLRECDERVAYALDGSGDRVTPTSAYSAVLAPDLVGPGMRGEISICEVECAHALAIPGARRIDHHRPGDPGYGRPPSEFLAASSLGQVIAELARLGRLDVRGWSYERTPRDDAREIGDLRVAGIGSAHPNLALRRWSVVAGTEGAPVAAEVPRHLAMIAAADHCLGAAYLGECPGVDPDALMRWRVESRARFQGRSAEEILADIARAREALRRAPEVDLAMCCYVRDLRDCHVPELPDAASRDGEAYLATVSVDGSGRPCRPKIVLGGATTPEMVRAFLKHWAPAHGLVDCYGDPERGFAGGYLPGEAQ